MEASVFKLRGSKDQTFYCRLVELPKRLIGKIVLAVKSENNTTSQSSGPNHFRGGSSISRRRGANPPGGANIRFCQIFQKSFTKPNLRKMEITIDLNKNLGNINRLVKRSHIS